MNRYLYFHGYIGWMKGYWNMEKLETLKKCDFCEKSGEDLSLLSANHKEYGWIMVCRDCWVNLYSKNRMISGSGSSGKSSNSPCSSCRGCSFR
jgi:hypothetical protein